MVNLKDLKIEFYKSGGPGGQHKNKRNMAVRITHLPTELVTVAQESRSQAANKAVALARIKEKLRLKFRKKTPRIPTREPKAVKEYVLQWKKKRATKKRLRRENIDIDY